MEEVGGGGREELKWETAVAVDAVVSCMLEVWHSCFMVVGVVGRAEKWDGSGWLGLAGSLGGWFSCWQGLENQGKVVA